MTEMYGDAHRKFLQGMMCRKLCSAAEAGELLAVCTEVERITRDVTAALPKFVKEVNQKITPYHMEIREGLDDDDGGCYYALVNCQESTVSLLASDFTAVELEFFQMLVKAVVRSDDGVVSSIDALNLSDDLSRPISKTDTEMLLKRLHLNKWIVERRGNIWLSVLTMLEFDQYIREMFPEHAQHCKLCKQLVLKGESCTSCETKLHVHCVKRLSKNMRSPSCPQCKAPLALASASEEFRAPGPSQVRRQGRKRKN